MSNFLNYEDFTTSLGANLNDEYVYENHFGFSSISFTIIPPTNGTVSFQGSFDGTNYFDIHFRETVSDAYIHKTTTQLNVMGSIVGCKKVKFITTTAGDSAGSINGRIQVQQSILEGIEHSNAPHNQGFSPVRKNFYYTTTQTNAVIWAPTTGKKYIITDLIINFYNPLLNPVSVEIFDEMNSSNNWLYKGIIAPGTTEHLVSNFQFPFVSSDFDNNLKLTTDDNIIISGMLHGYEVD